jgi:hypothetical protein
MLLSVRPVPFLATRELSFLFSYQRNETDLYRELPHRRVRAPMLMLGVGAAMASSRDKFMPIHRETFRSLYAKRYMISSSRLPIALGVWNRGGVDR